MKTYTSVRKGPKGFVSDAVRLYGLRSSSIESDVARTIEQRKVTELDFQRRTGRTLEGTDLLVVGGGQTSREIIAFGVNNRVTAIDLDVIPHGWKPGPYVALLRQNGPARTAKTVGRKLLGVDLRFSKALRRELGIQQKPQATYLQMDASAMTFPEASFDVVYSYSVFEHLPDPKAVLQEAARVLRPGGMLYTSVHMYASEGGCHDVRIFAGDRADIPYWAHLRPTEKHTVLESCYMNEWRLDQWQKLFTDICPDGSMSIETHHEPFNSFLTKELTRLRSLGELDGYTDEELLGVNVQYSWTKPGLKPQR